MSAQPPPSERPTGPPSGPLSGPSQDRPTHATPPPGAPPGPPSGGGAGGPGGPGGGGPAKGSGEGPDHPWWRSVPRIATIAVAIVAAVVLTIVLTRPGGGGGEAVAAEIVRDPVNSSGEAPFTPPSTAEEAPSKEPPAPPATNLRGSDAGVYGGTQQTASCDVEKQIRYLSEDPAKNRAFASVVGRSPSQVPGYLRSLTPLRLSYDTRVTNHSYKNGAPTKYQSVLQAGTAVLVDDHGVPRVRCACGNPLQPPVKVEGNVRLTGPTWSGFQPTKVVHVQRSVTVINVFVVYDPDHEDWFAREHGDHHGRYDKKVPPPPRPRPSYSPSPHTSSPSKSPSSKHPSSKHPSSKHPSSKHPSSKHPSSKHPSSKHPSSKHPSSKHPSSKHPSSKHPSSKSPSSEPPTSGTPSSKKASPESPPPSDSAPMPPPADSPASEPEASSAPSPPVAPDASPDSAS
ncbi:DUF6777 domain-containing protein [Streptomyces sp. NPDC019443]|uniref:DUF6777 domain-containing protein n=1 Tax=Streptomyces sp. NPDC019443 TaxID=3365061 RepID=UPI0037B22C0D